ncbi:exonuclease domain-containing protein [Fictibacillus gelatini]|uniref:exonuclease domain-containing protein n=1 Tax=Fictibacillus gelatini TaxID=225985 RepID=UPI000428AAD1|nr:exonuclease domain-containing protein [Fictibacillus gelatini]
MNPPRFDGNFKHMINRLLSLGLKREQLIGGHVSQGDFQHEAWIRKQLKAMSRKKMGLNTPIEEVTFIILDTETTGFRPDLGDEIFSIAAARIKNGEITNRYSTFINPGKTIPESVQQLTGIQDGDVSHAPFLKDEIQSLLDFIHHHIIVGYHIGHDLAFLNHFLWKTYKTKLPQSSLEMRKVLESFLPGMSFPLLDDALRYFSIECTNRHQAESDVFAMCELWQKIFAIIRKKNIQTLYDFYGYIR